MWKRPEDAASPGSPQNAPGTSPPPPPSPPGSAPPAPVRVVQDPRNQVSEADLAEQLRFTLEVQDAISRTARSVTRLRTSSNRTR